MPHFPKFTSACRHGLHRVVSSGFNLLGGHGGVTVRHAHHAHHGASSLQLANAIYKYTLFININIIKSVFGPKKTKNIPLLIWSSFLETHVQ
jgi:hypothetical protein